MHEQLSQAAQIGDRAKVNEILTVHPELLEANVWDGWTPLHLASFFGHRELAADLVKRGANVAARSSNYLENQPLHAAVAGKRREVAKWLVEQGADVNSTQSGGWTPLHAAAQNGDEDLCRFLLEHGARKAAVSGDGCTPANMAKDKGYEHVAAMLTGAMSAGG